MVINKILGSVCLVCTYDFSELSKCIRANNSLEFRPEIIKDICSKIGISSLLI